VKEFVQLCSAMNKLSLERLEFIKLLSEMIESIAHELVHLEEDTDCESTHDQRFKQQLAEKLNLLFVGKTSQFKTPLQLAEEFLM
jgi:hypothetical protein